MADGGETPRPAVDEDSDEDAPPAEVSASDYGVGSNQHKVWEKENTGRRARFEAALERIGSGTSEKDTEDLSMCGLQAEDARALASKLAGNSTLTKLDLYDNKIGDEGLIALAKSLESHKALKVLNLKWNHFGATNQVGGTENDKGVLDLAKALKNNKVLQQVNLQWNQVWEDGKLALANTRQVPTGDAKAPFFNRYIDVDGGLPNTGVKGGFTFT